ncbi:MAG TPA: hypothetical protein VNY83_09825 [Solirubrobacterales bacterium]|nr:hypothetical protein [Solirubrobacterales bacterium]
MVERGILSFRPFFVDGHDPVRIDLSGDVSFQRPRPERADDWRARPLLKSTVTVELVDHASEELLERHHHDLANSGQEGPVWHLQYGGNPADSTKPLPTSWIDPPRWAVPPMDLTLLAETIVYNFFRAEWEELNRRNEWVTLILDAEQLVMSHFAGHMQAHFGRDRSLVDRTWLTAQDNILSGLNPRPSA